MRGGAWSRGAKVGTAILAAALLVGVAGCGRAADTEADAAAAQSAEPEEPSFAVGDVLVDERPLMVDAWSDEEALDYPEFEERVATIDKAMGIVSDGMERMLTTGEFSMEPYEDMRAMFSAPWIMDEDLDKGQDHLALVIPALGEGGGLPVGYGGETSRNGERLPDLKVVGGPRIGYANTAKLAVDDEGEDKATLYGAMNALIQVDLEDDTTATYAYYISFNSASRDPADELSGWRTNVQFLGVG